MINRKGFTLIELMVVISIIGILAAIAIPQFSRYRSRAAASEGNSLFVSVKTNISDFYDYTGRLPEDNQEAGIAAPQLICGKHVESITVRTGAVEIRFRQESPACYSSRHQRYYPVVPKDNPAGSVSWISYKSQIQPWMKLFHDIQESEDNF